MIWGKNRLWPYSHRYRPRKIDLAIDPTTVYFFLSSSKSLLQSALKFPKSRAFHSTLSGWAPLSAQFPPFSLLFLPPSFLPPWQQGIIMQRMQRLPISLFTARRNSWFSSFFLHSIIAFINPAFGAIATSNHLILKWDVWRQPQGQILRRGCWNSISSSSTAHIQQFLCQLKQHQHVGSQDPPCLTS